MRIIFAGTPAVAVPSLDALVNAGFDVAAVLTREDAPVGRKRVFTPSAVAARAAELGLDVVRANRIDDSICRQIAGYRPEAAAIVAYGGLVPPNALAIPAHGWVNLHFSLLPAWRGAAPVQHAVITGDDITGASTFRLEEGLDTGPVFGQLTETIRPEDTAGDLLQRLSISGAVLLVQTLKAIDAGEAAAVPQEGTVSLAPKLTLDDGRIRWSDPALSIRRRINGVTPEPGAWTTLDGQRFKLGPVTLRQDIRGLEPGALVIPDGGRAVLVGTGSCAVALSQVQPAGRKMMAALDWARGSVRNTDVMFQ